MALAAVGFIKDDPVGLGGLCVATFVPEEGVRFTLTPDFGFVLRIFTAAVRCVVLLFAVFMLLGFSGIRFTVLVEVALFSELLELTMLLREFERWTLLRLLLFMPFWESVFRKLPDLLGMTLFFDGSWVVWRKMLVLSKLRFNFWVRLTVDAFGVIIFGDLMWTLAALVVLVSSVDVWVGFGFP